MTPTSPATGCQTGMVTGVASLMIMSVGVKGGINESVVAMLPAGFCIMGTMINSGRMTGIIAGN